MFPVNPVNPRFLWRAFRIITKQYCYIQIYRYMLSGDFGTPARQDPQVVVDIGLLGREPELTMLTGHLERAKAGRLAW